MTAMQAQDLQAALWAVGQRVPGLRRGRRPRRRWTKGDRPLLADARHAAPAGSGGPALDAGHHRRPPDPRHGRPPPGAGDRRPRRGRCPGGGAGTGLGRRSGHAPGSSSRPSKPRASPRLASAASTCWGSCASGPGWCRDRSPGTSSSSRRSTSGSRNPGTWTAPRASPSWLLRYMLSHGPATERDFAWWSNTPVTEVRSGLALVKDQLVELEFEGTSYWMSPATAALLDDGVPGQRSAAGTARVRRVPAGLHGPVAGAAAGACPEGRSRRQRGVQEDHCRRRRSDRHLGAEGHRPDGRRRA